MKTLFSLFRPFISLGLVLMFVTACDSPTAKDLSLEAIIPKPTSVVATGSSFKISADTRIITEIGYTGAGLMLAELLRPATGFALEIGQADGEVSEGISLKVMRDAELGEEGYKLNITEDVLELIANKEAGLIRGIQTIRQLLPAEVESKNEVSAAWEIASGFITDVPAYEYRGAMLDVSRHFFTVEDVKKYIDYLAYFKMNALHLHLSDDQGWRIEIKSWPRLTTHGGSTEVGGGTGGFYTQNDYRDIVAYAAKRHIMIIPEIDMPGHTNAALAAYADLNCDGKARDLYTGTNVGFSTFCTDKELTYQFIDDVIRELAALTPGPYIHIGGDESHVTELKDYIPFINRVQDIIGNHGKTMIGWDEISQAALNDRSVVQHWNNTDFARNVAERGGQLIMSPAKRAYLDMKYDSTTKLGLNWAAYIEVNDGYDWDLATYAENVGKESILGIESPLWSETVTNMDEIEQLLFPRLAGYAEIGWSSQNRSWNEYKSRLQRFDKRFEVMGINYYRSPVVWDKP